MTDLLNFLWRNTLGKLLCSHNFVFKSNLYGDMINGRGYKRSVWMCTKCRRFKYKNELYK